MTPQESPLQSVVWCGSLETPHLCGTIATFPGIESLAKDFCGAEQSQGGSDLRTLREWGFKVWGPILHTCKSSECLGEMLSR